MKKKIFGVALIATMAVTASWNFNQSKNEVKLSELSLANIEALARGEYPEITGWNDRYRVMSWDNNTPPRIQQSCTSGGSDVCP